MASGSRWGRLVVTGLTVLAFSAACDSGDDDVDPERAATTTGPSGPSTTTAPAPTPTTAGVRRAVIVGPFAVVGWWDGQAWVPADGAVPVPVAGGEAYSVLGLTGPDATEAGSKAEAGCDTNRGASKITIAGLEGLPRPAPVAVSGVAQPRPRPTTALGNDSEVYRDAAGKALAERGIDDADADLAQVLKADLDGDGRDEVVMVAERIGDPSLFAQAGDYSVVLLRRVVDEAAVTTVVAESVAPPKGETPSIESFRVSAIADLNGDGRMEVAMDTRYYEGAGTAIYELTPEGGLTRVLASGCGA